jgi:hypothetical protein
MNYLNTGPCIHHGLDPENPLISRRLVLGLFGVMCLGSLPGCGKGSSQDSPRELPPGRIPKPGQKGSERRRP